MDEVKLLPCPFCGKDAALVLAPCSEPIAYVSCECGANGADFAETDDGDQYVVKAIAAWNTLVTDEKLLPCDRVADGTTAFALEGADELERLGNKEKSLVGAIPAIVADERQREHMAFHEGEARRWYRLANAVRTLAADAARPTLVTDEVVERSSGCVWFHVKRSPSVQSVQKANP